MRVGERTAGVRGDGMHLNEARRNLGGLIVSALAYSGVVAGSKGNQSDWQGAVRSRRRP